MKTKTSTRTLCGTVAVLCAALTLAPRADAGALAPDLEAKLAVSRPTDNLAVIMTFADKLDLTAYQWKGRGTSAARAGLLKALQEKAAATQKNATALLASSGVKKSVSLWLINGMSFTAPAWVVRLLPVIPGVDTIRLDATLGVPQPLAGTSSAPEWNLEMVRAPEMWSLGYTGNGVVVAGMDTGADIDHPDLAGSFRGGSNSWYDPNGEHPSPYDANGHGTQTLGIIVGGSSGGTAIGMAPGAKWIAVKIFNDAGVASLSAVHQGFQWLLDPDGDPATDDAPDVVNNSWGYPNYLNQCYQEFAQDIAVLRSADIAVVVAAGNSGPATPSSESPADNPGSLAVGAVDQTSTVASFSSRGPSACDGSVFPEAVAPGVNIRVADLTFGGIIPNSYAYANGTSFAAPHVAGALALLLSAHPDATVAALEQAIEGSAVDRGAAGADDAYGYGLIDVTAADALLGPGGVAAADDSYATAEDTSLTVAAPGVLLNDTGTGLTAAPAGAPSHGSIVLGADGSFTYTPDPNFSGSDTFRYTASDGTQTSPAATVRIAVSAVNDAPVAAGDSYAATAGTALSVAPPGVLGNDTDADGNPLTAVLAGAPAHAASFSLNANGSFTYTATAGYSGADAFTYVASDGTGTSNLATVTVTVSAPVNTAPVAANDGYATTAGTALSVAAPGVLGNDADADGNPLTAVLAGAPAHAASFTLNAGGSFTYTAAAGYSGPDAFTYRASDGTATSNLATVTLTVTKAANQPPVAANDSASTSRNTKVTIKVLANDRDPDGAIVASTVAIVSGPANGTASRNSNGTIAYMPKRNYRGTDTFSYTVKDNAGAVSNVATVTVTVR